MKWWLRSLFLLRGSQASRNRRNRDLTVMVTVTVTVIVAKVIVTKQVKINNRTRTQVQKIHSYLKIKNKVINHNKVNILNFPPR